MTTNYKTLDDYTDLTTDEMSSASTLSFNAESPREFSYTSLTSYTHIFSWEGLAGMLYMALADSTSTPDFMSINDEFGNVIRVATSKYEVAPHSTALMFVAPYTGTYYIDVDWQEWFSVSDYGIFVPRNLPDPSGVKTLPNRLRVIEDVSDLNNQPTGTVQITGKFSKNETLTASDTINDEDGIRLPFGSSISYQWLRNGEAIVSAKESTYKLTDSDVNNVISAKAMYIDNLGNYESVTSNGTMVLAVASTKPTIGNDKLTGTTKNDKFSALAGDDTLIGGFGSDTLTGGLGADVFQFNEIKETGLTVKTRDTITDFKFSDGDKIDLSAIDADTFKTGNQAFSKLDIGAKFSGKFTSTGQLFFDTTSHILYGNVDIKAGADFSIQLNGVVNLVVDDFVL